MKKRIVGIDYGKKRLGIALSDPSQRVALPFAMVEGGEKSILHILKALEPYKKEIEKMVIGLPLLMNGTEGEMAQAVRSFGKKMEEATGLAIIFVDERLSSLQADKRLKELSFNRKARTAKVDMVAATLLLQSYLDSLF